MLDAYELYGAEIDDEILKEVTGVRTGLLEDNRKDSGPPSGVPAANMFQSMLDANTAAIMKTIANQIPPATLEKVERFFAVRITGAYQQEIENKGPRCSVITIDRSNRPDWSAEAEPRSRA